MQNLFFTDCVNLVGSACPPFDGTRKYVSTGAVDTDRINDADVEIVDYQGKPSRANLVVSSGDVLFAKMQGTKKTLLIDNQLSQHIYSTGFCAVHARRGLLTNRCLYHILSSQMFLAQKDKNCSGATQKAITNAGLGKIQIRVPNIEQQDIIADQLDSIVSILEKRQQQLSVLDDLIKARFVEMFGDPVVNPKDWLQASLGEYMTVLADFNANGSYEVLDSSVVMYDTPNYAIMVRTTDLEAGSLTSFDGVKYIDQNAYELLSKSKLLGGELIMNKIGSAGKIYIMPFINRPASLGRNAFLFRFDDRLNMTFLFALLTSDYGKKEIQQYVRGAVTKTITKDSTRAIRIFVPPIELQEQFDSFVKQVDKSRMAIHNSISEIQMLYNTLMGKYFG